MSESVSMKAILELSPDERIHLVEDIWDSIAADAHAIPVTDAQEAELDRRLEEHQKNPENVLTW